MLLMKRIEEEDDGDCDDNDFEGVDDVDKGGFGADHEEEEDETRRRRRTTTVLLQLSSLTPYHTHAHTHTHLLLRSGGQQSARNSARLKRTSSFSPTSIGGPHCKSSGVNNSAAAIVFVHIATCGMAELHLNMHTSNKQRTLHKRSDPEIIHQ